jgi:hypothetical protein
MANGIGGFFDDVAGNPLIALGAGLLAASGPSAQPVSRGQVLGQGLQFASAAQQRQQQGALQQLRMEEARQRMLDRARQERTGSELAAFVDMIGPQAAAPALPGAGGFLPGGGVTTGMGAPPPATTPGILSQEQADFLRRLAPIAPDFVGQQVAGLLFAEPQQPTTFQRDFEFMTAPKEMGGLGLDAETALDRLKKGVTVNVGAAGDEPMNVSDLIRLRLPDGSTPPPGTTLSQAVAMGATILPRAETAAESDKATATALSLDVLDRFEAAVKEGNIQPGFIDEGGIAGLLATPGGQVATTAAGLLGADVSLTPEQAEALSLQEQLGNQLLAAMRGASVGPEEQKKFEQQMPRLSQPRALFEANLRNTRRNLELLAARQEELRTGQAAPAEEPGADAPPALSAAEQTLLNTPSDQLDADGQAQLDALLKRMGF